MNFPLFRLSATAIFSLAVLTREAAGIIEGTEAVPGRYPYYVHMRITRDDGSPPRSCGGSLISPRVVLTAARCNDDDPSSGDDTTVVADGFVGATVFWSTDDGAVLGECEEWRNHPMYGLDDDDGVPAAEQRRYLSGGVDDDDDLPGSYDLALCLLKEPVDIQDDDSAAAVVLELNDDPFFPPEQSSVVEAMGMGMGMGPTSSVVEETNVLLRADLPIYPQDSCAKFYDDLDDRTAICTWDWTVENRSGVCGGDSGGPIVVSSSMDANGGETRHVQVGVVLAGSSDHCGTDAPDVHARVSSGMPWIRETVCDDWGLSQESSTLCDGRCSESVVTVRFTTDGTPDDNSWTLSDALGNILAESKDDGGYTEPFTEYVSEDICLPAGDYAWGLTASSGGGMPEGSAVLLVNDDEVVFELNEGESDSGTFLLKKFTIVDNNNSLSDNLTNDDANARNPKRRSSSRSSSTTTVVTSDENDDFVCDTDQILTVTVRTDRFPGENRWIVERYDNDVWTEFASDPLEIVAADAVSVRSVCLDETLAAYRFRIFDAYGDGLCYYDVCGSFELTLNGNEIRIQGGGEGLNAAASFGFESTTTFTTCVNSGGYYDAIGNVSGVGVSVVSTCDKLYFYLAARDNTEDGSLGRYVCTRLNDNIPGTAIYQFCPDVCAAYGEGPCAFPYVA